MQPFTVFIIGMSLLTLWVLFVSFISNENGKKEDKKLYLTFLLELDRLSKMREYGQKQISKQKQPQLN